MFEQLFGSKTRVKLLSLFLNNPGRSYYVREITRKIDEQINSVRRELSNLLSIGIISSESSNNRLYYEVNDKYEHYQELRSIFASIPVKSRAIKSTKEEDEITKKLRSAGSIELAFLTGSFVNDSRSSVDICLVGDLNRSALARAVGDIEKEVGRDLNYTYMTPEEYQYRMSLNDRFLNSIMEAKKITLIDANEKPIGHVAMNIAEDDDAEPIVVKVTEKGSED